MKEKQTYRSVLRQEQMKKTREQILEGLVKTMAQGIAEISIPAVAREAGVSIPTVYRYFRTKRDLIEALGGYVVQKAGFAMSQPPHSPEELLTMVKQLFIRYAGIDETLRAAAMSDLAYGLRKEAIPMRQKMIEDALAPGIGQVNEADRIPLRDIVLVLTSTAMIRACKDYLNLSGEEAADTVTWAIRTLIQGASQRDVKPNDET